ncbi:MAG TPA: Rrf2 family transcriptional regulator [Anaerolineae bacterium]|nr:Rrf2 family transcriptional regulator [Anaerolineae bacterium]HOG46339.1 Rrf2 family transcriptional regulator [Anaerolineae bacterium]HOQ99292.1 Rrf2 family transcriptional regulator [Anaerolineae bacterium]HPL30571.1 Rrf2 family transcriptional regulator [Anaerolineae bacterium]
MRFSAKEQYGLRAMAELASRYGQGQVALSEVAQSQGISLATLEQVVAPLRRAGLLESTRGASGGYALARPPQAISVGDVLRAIDGALVPIPCLEDAGGACCERAHQCATRPVWALVRARLAETLDSLTLADVCRQDIT